MECKRCGDEIRNGEILCDSCTEEIERETRVSRVTRNKYRLDREFTIETPITREDKLNIEIEKETEEESVKKKKKKKIIIIASSIAGGLLLLGIVLFFVLRGGKPEEEETIDYQAIMEAYAEEIERVALIYHNANGTLPTKERLLEEITFDYNVDCEEIEILHPNLIRLIECRVESSEELFSKEILLEDIAADILTVCYGPVDTISWHNNTMPGTCPSGSGLREYKIECITDQCNIVEAFSEYVTILERNGNIWVYNFIREEIVYENDENHNIRFITYRNRLLAFVLVNERNQLAIYNRASEELVIPFGRLRFNEDMMYVVRGINNHILVFESGMEFGALNLANGRVIIPVEYDAIFRFEQMEDRYLIGAKNQVMYLIETDTGTVLLNGRSFSAISPTSNLGGHALVMDGNYLRLLKINGEEVISQRLEGDVIFFDAGVSNNLMRVYIKVFEMITLEEDDCVEYAYDFRTASFHRTGKQICVYNTM